MVQRLGSHLRYARQAAKRANSADIGDNALIFPVLITDEDHAVHRNGSQPQRLERQQRVVDGAE
ncbi:hypothetical protein D3C87_1627760 [compost metagenome]